MKKALISPEEEVYHITEGDFLGYRVAQVEDNAFDVCEPLFWVDCDDHIVADRWCYDKDTKKMVEVPLPPELDLN
jgi:hypothetical protein